MIPDKNCHSMKYHKFPPQLHDRRRPRTHAKKRMHIRLCLMVGSFGAITIWLGLPIIITYFDRFHQDQIPFAMADDL